VERKFVGLDESRQMWFEQQEQGKTYSLQKIDGQVSVDRRTSILEEGLSVGDPVVIIRLPDGTCVLSKTDDLSALRIKKITTAYVQLDGEINVREV
jgi:hypothetical protein